MLGAGAVVVAMPLAFAQAGNTARILVGFPPGQATDQVARLVADRLTGALGYTVIVENMPGQGGSIALSRLAKAPPDGSLMSLSALAAYVVNQGLKQANKLDLITIAYKSTPGAQQDVIGGTVPVMVDSMGAAMGHLRGGSLVLLAVTSKTRAEGFPNVPTVIELGFDNREYLGWYGVLAPKGTPAAIIERLNAEINKAMQAPEIAERVKALGAAPAPGTAERFCQFMVDERAKWGGIARAANIRLQ